MNSVKSVNNKLKIQNPCDHVRPVKDSDIPAIRLLVNSAYKELSDMGLNYTGTYQDEEVTRNRINKSGFFCALFRSKTYSLFLV
jgi:hypothetical protein